VNVDISKGGGSESNLFISVHILPIVVHIGDPQDSCDQLSEFSGGGSSVSSQASVVPIEKSSTPFICEKFFISCEFGHRRYFFFLLYILHNSINLCLVKLKTTLETHGGTEAITSKVQQMHV
jgi:hypothetical protein